MRYILSFLILIVAGCSGQSASDQRSKIDTTKLFNPHPETDEIGASEMNIFKRNILLARPGYYVVFNEREHEMETLDKARAFIQSNAEQIRKNKFYIITDSSTTFKKIVSVIDVLTENQINDYKVINVQEYFTPPEPVAIQTPASVETIYDPDDSTYFSITILDRGIDVKLSGQKTQLKTPKDLDEFIGTHKPDIKKILIVMSKDLPNNKLDPVIEVLKKHAFYKFSLVSK